MKQRTRVTIIAGFLGAGKTTVLRNVIQQLPQSTRIGVLVNEFGAVGVDGAAYETTREGLDIKELAAGCICCTALVAFKQTVVQMLRKKPEHLFVEPTGLAELRHIVNVFAQHNLADAVKLEPSLVVVDPRQWDSKNIRDKKLYQEQVKNADVLIMSHSDCCTPELIARFKEAHRNTTIIQSDNGVLESPLQQNSEMQLTLLEDEQSEPTVTGFFSEMFWFAAEQHISIPAIELVLTQNPPPDTVVRCKGIVHSDEGWQEIHLNHLTFTREQTKKSSFSRIIFIAIEDESSRGWWRTVKPLLEALPTK